MVRKVPHDILLVLGFRTVEAVQLGGLQRCAVTSTQTALPNSEFAACSLVGTGSSSGMACSRAISLGLVIRTRSWSLHTRTGVQHVSVGAVPLA